MVYSGGISKGAYQIGFTRALLRYIDISEIKVVTGASIGLFCAYALSTGKLDVLECAYRKLDLSGGFELFYKVFFRKLLWKSISAFLSPADTLEIPLAFPVCYVPICTVRYYWLLGRYNACWEKYFRAAVNFPFLCLFPTFLERRFALDGGAVDNIPLFPLLKEGKKYAPNGDFDLLIVLHFDARYDYRSEFETDIPVLELDLGICNDFKKNHYDFSNAYVAEMIEKGEKYGEAICERLFSGDVSREALQRTVDEIFMEEHAERQKNISVDHFFSLLNKVGKLFRNETACNKKLF